MTKLVEQNCQPLSGPEHRLAEAEIVDLRAQLPEWTVDAEQRLQRRFEFADFAAALRFTNQLGEIAEAQGHHPDLELGWGYVVVHLSTHDVGGLSRNDFIMAALISQLAA